MTQEEQLTIVGSGCAGWTAAIYASRGNLDPFLLEGPVDSKDNPPGGQLMLTTDVENYPGFPEGVGGPELMEKFRDQAIRFGTRTEKEKVNDVDFTERPFHLMYGPDNKEIRSESVILCTGASARKLGLESERKLFGHGGLSSCATCDGALFEGKRMVVIGGGDSAMEEALFLTNYATEVLVIHRRENLRASEIMGDRAKEHDKISFLWNTEVIKFLDDDGMISGVRVIRHPDGKPKEKYDGPQSELEEIEELSQEGFEIWDEPCGAAFLAIGQIPNTRFLNGDVQTDEDGYIELNDYSMTHVDGVFAAGDCVDDRYEQAVTAAGMGCQAAMDCERWLDGQL